MALTETSASDLWVSAVRHRNRSTIQRMCTGVAACLIFTPLLSWQVCIVWLVLYLSVQALEREVFAPLMKDDSEQISRLRALLGNSVMALNASLFGIIAVPSWLVGGPMGGVAASLLLSAGTVNSVIMSAGSLRVFACTVLPQLAILATTPFFMASFGASSDVVIAASVAIAAYGGFCVSIRQHLFRARRAESRARIEADRKHLEAEKAMNSRAAFLAAVAHDLRTPISAIMTGASELSQTDSPASRRQHTALITDASHMMRDLLNDLLDHSRLEAGRMAIETHDFDLRQLLSQTARLWSPTVRAKGLKLRLEGSRNLPRHLKGDPMRLRQVLNNLISNALKFTSQGAITLRMKSWQDENGAHVLLIDVVDTGSGMSPAQIARLFTPFDQTTDGVAARFGGSGLGLAISRNLIELMGGRLTVRSQPGQGSIFTLAITLAQGQALSTRCEPIGPHFVSSAPDRHSDTLSPSIHTTQAEIKTGAEIGASEDQAILRVLVVDDHAINRRAIQLILHHLDCHITMAENGLDALNLCETQAFDIIFMDVRMPELDGRETTRRLRSSGGINARVPVVAVTADNASEDITACLAAGMTSFVAKPLSPRTLLNALQEALSGEEAAASDDNETTAFSA